MTPAADAVLGLFLRVPECVDACSIPGLDMREHPHIVYSALAAFVARDVLAGKGGLDAAVERAGAYIEELAAGGDPEIVRIVEFGFLHALKIEMGTAAIDLAFLGPQTRRLLRSMPA
jgi:hypothetical protein